MDAELKAKWVRALRSKKYKQAEGQLRDSNGAFCCIGVLGEIQGIDWSKVDKLVTNDLPRGLNARVPEEKRRLLAAMNDGSFCGGKTQDKHSFREIADYIDKHL